MDQFKLESMARQKILEIKSKAQNEWLYREENLIQIWKAGYIAGSMAEQGLEPRTPQIRTMRLQEEVEE